MDLTTVVIAAGFVVYGAFVYNRRERAYRRVLHQIGRGETPLESPAPPALWRLIALAGVTFLLFAFVVGSVVQSFVRGLGAGGPTLVLGGACLAPLVILVLMFLRDRREYRRHRRV